MIVSVHVPKTAGTSFHNLLRKRLGERMLYDYGDWPEERNSEALAYQEERRQEAIAEAANLERRHDLIHGHFTAAKYQGVFTFEQTVVFFRNPYQRAVSMYEHALREIDSPHPRFRLFKEKGMSLLDLIAEVPNQQSLYVAGRPLTDFAMIGITERFNDSLALFEWVTGVALDRGAERWNVNPAHSLDSYAIDEDVRKQVEHYHADDLQLYTQATEHFKALLDRHRPSNTDT